MTPWLAAEGHAAERLHNRGALRNKLFTRPGRPPFVRAAAVLLILAIVLGGCSEPSLPAEPPVGPVLPPPGTNATQPPPKAEWFNFSLAAEEYNHSLQRYQLAALGPGVVAIHINGSIGALGYTSNCAVATVDVRSRDDLEIASGGVIVWAAGETNYVAAELAGRGIGTSQTDSPGGSSAPSSHTIGAAVEVATGDRLTVELGGGDPAFMNGTFTNAESDDAPQANFLNVSVHTSGQVEWAPLPSRPLRCGSGTAGMDRAARVEAPRFEAQLQGRVGMNTTSASTLLFFDTGGPAGAFNAAEVTFMDQNHTDPRALALTAPQAGHVEIQLERWVSPGGPTPLWLVADTHWPFVSALAEAS